MEKIDRYKEILEVLEKHKGILKDDYRIDIAYLIEVRIKVEELSKKFGIELKADSRTDWLEIGEHQSIGLYGEKHGRTISWSDDGRQPEDEYLYVINFPTGPYIFGRDYPCKTFNAFFAELKSYEPKYIDSANSALYFTSEKAKAVNDDFDEIFNKYRLQIAEELREKEIELLKEKLKSLQA